MCREMEQRCNVRAETARYVHEQRGPPLVRRPRWDYPVITGAGAGAVF